MDGVVQVILVALFASAECIRLDDFYPYGESAGDRELERGDDQFHGPLQLRNSFPYFNKEERNLYVSIAP